MPLAAARRREDIRGVFTKAETAMGSMNRGRFSAPIRVKNRRISAFFLFTPMSKLFAPVLNIWSGMQGLQRSFNYTVLSLYYKYFIIIL